jgi:hypothetical protein
MTERNYLHSRPLDVHRWSEHPEVNILVRFLVIVSILLGVYLFFAV